MNIFCKALGHKRSRGRVWHDGLDYRGYCKRCEAPLIRDLGNWRAFDAEREGKGRGVRQFRH